MRDVKKVINKVAILSIKPEYTKKILLHEKTIELRKSTFGLQKGDFIIVYTSAPNQCIELWFRIKKVEVSGVKDLWNKYNDELGINHEEYLSYFNGCKKVTGLHIGDLNQLDPVIPLKKIQQLVPDFVPPQGIIWIKNNMGRFAGLINALSPPLPPNAFPQLSLFNCMNELRAF